MADPNNLDAVNSSEAQWEAEETQWEAEEAQWEATPEEVLLSDFIETENADKASAKIRKVSKVILV